jgi:hypothetical protein
MCPLFNKNSNPELIVVRNMDIWMSNIGQDEEGWARTLGGTQGHPGKKYCNLEEIPGPILEGKQ